MIRSAIVTLAGLTLLSACQAAGTASAPAEAAPAATSTSDIEGVRGGETTLSVGQTLHIALPSNATTGYQWQISGVEGSVLTPAEPFGDEVVDPHAPGMVGVGGQTHWRLVASRPGSATLTFTYARSWERNTPPAETATYRIVVR
ncbi:protease inhibitor I42 family protein [Brevundimonas sp.]|jgi:inhibitor of cysteine peptidase|uniref:protease inhibitor I42 family protein n=1 Tax=Brevundimonas sp. TaxID=1871086 RepID=UPI00391ADFFE